MNSLFKFLRRVRIHGGECGAVARALHHEAKKQSLPAVKENVSFTTNERKQMSTKTIFKRLALVVVSSLGLSLVSGPATLATYDESNPTQTSVTVSAVGREQVGIEIYAYSQNHPTQYACGDECYLHTRLISAPSTAGVVSTTSSIDSSITLGGNVALANDSITVSRWTDSAWVRAYLGQTAGQDTYTAGTYTIQWWVDTLSAKNKSAPANFGGATKSGTISVTLRGAPTQVTLDATTGTGDSSTITTNQVTATFKDAGGFETILTSGESYAITTGANVASTLLPEFIGDTISASSYSSGHLQASADSRVSTGRYIPPYYANQAINGAVALTATASSNGEGTAAKGRELNPQHSGVVTFWVGASKTSATFKVRGVADLSGIDSSNFTLTNANPAVIAHACLSSSLNAGRVDTSSASLGVRNTSYSRTMECADQTTAAVADEGTEFYASTATGKTLYWTIQTAATGLVKATVAARTGVILPAGITAGAIDYTSDSTFATISQTATSPGNNEGYDLTLNMSSGKTYVFNITYKAPIVNSTIGAVTSNMDASPRAAVGSTNTVTYTVKDGFGSVVSGATVKFQHNRNPLAAYSDLVSATTNASGQASFTFKDTLATTATITTLNSAGTLRYYASTANATSEASSTNTLNFTSASFIAPGVISITESAEDDDSVGNVVDATISETITVTTETGTAMAGVPYTVTLSDGLYERSSTYSASGTSQLTGYTDSSGQAFVRVAGFKSGVGTVTFTVGSLTKSDTFTVLSSSTKFRAVSTDKTTVATDVDTTAFVTITARDIYNNVVPSMNLTVTYTGSNARIVSFNGAQANSATTNANGVLVIGIYADKAGSGTLKVETTAGVAVTTTTTSQGVAPIARVSDVSVAVTSSGVSAVQAAAEAATDAAAEAIDAANAATDAANLAAEAADAATVAAEEARDAADAATAAVEELATQVATLMAALKAQITTLANTVAKIAKKVKA